jgi:hypothetical protein
VIIYCETAKKAVGKGHISENITDGAVSLNPGLPSIGGLIKSATPAIAGIIRTTDYPAF